MIVDAVLSGGERRADDFYPTPKEATYALLPLIADWPKQIWEPACGDGAIADVLFRNGYDVVATDLVYRGYGGAPVDFLKSKSRWGVVIVTNPPFKLAAEFIEQANDIGATHMALLLKADFWHAAKRLRIWDLWPPYAAYPMTFRLDFTGAGSPHTNFTWFLWDRTSPPLARPLAKPDVEALEMLS